MFCFSCGCELPITAKFCFQCGAHVERPTTQGTLQAASIKSAENILDAERASDSPANFCSYCGVQYSASDRFCNHCGSQIVSAITALKYAENNVSKPSISVSGIPDPAQPQTTNQNAQAVQSATLASVEPPYAVFVSQILGFALAASVVAFNVASDVAHKYWRSTFSTLIASAIGSIFLVSAINTWGKVRNWSGKQSYGKKLCTQSMVFVVLFIVIAVIVGGAIGTSGKETADMVSDFADMSKIGDRISKARSGADQTVPAQIEMYTSIESDVSQFDVVLRRLQVELTAYDQKFPAQHDQTAKSMHSIEIALKRAALLKQQIDTARELQYLEPTMQSTAWQERMEPLLNAETALDKN